MSHALDPDVLAPMGLGCVFLGTAGILHCLLSNPGSVAALSRYERALDTELTRALAPPRGRLWVRVQICVSALLLLSLVFAPVLAGLVIAVWWLPPAWLARGRAARVLSIEEQLDGWLMGLTSALRTAPALGDALSSTVGLVRGPLRAELSLVLRQFRMGVPLDTALSESAQRVGSTPLSAIVATLRIARRSGGNLASTLERNAHTLREMARLEGVIRTKTASGRAQANTISLVPIGLVATLHNADPTFLAPVLETMTGHALAAITCVLWLVAVFWARKIVAVEV